MWCLQTYIMLSSGVPLVSALESMATSDLPRVAPTCEVLAEKLSSGFRLSEAMKSLGNTFNDFIISIVKLELIRLLVNNRTNAHISICNIH